MQRLAPPSGVTSRALTRAAQLVAEHGWTVRTARTRDTQWKTWLEFCKDDHRDALPVTEAHFVAFIGWIVEMRESKRHRIGSSSVPQYLSAVRQRQLALLGEEVPPFPFVSHVIRAYERWEEKHHPQTAVRCGVPAKHLYRVWELGMSTAQPEMVRACAMTLFAYSFNGLRESSVVSLRTSDVEVSASSITARLCVVKGRTASSVPLVRFTRDETPSPMDLWEKWARIRGPHERFFALPDESVTWQPGCLTAALSLCLDTLLLNPPPGGKFSSHSLRIGAHTEQVLLGIPLEVRLARFGWGPRSAEMASVYFDRTIATTRASFWIFGAAIPVSAGVSMAAAVSTPTA